MDPRNQRVRSSVIGELGENDDQLNFVNAVIFILVILTSKQRPRIITELIVNLVLKPTFTIFFYH